MWARENSRLNLVGYLTDLGLLYHPPKSLRVSKPHSQLNKAFLIGDPHFQEGRIPGRHRLLYL